MLRSQSHEDGGQEFATIKTPKHITQVWQVIDANFARYWQRLIDEHSEAATYNVLLKKFAGTPRAINTASALRPLFSNARQTYAQAAESYRKLFDLETLQEYQDDDPHAFKKALTRDCPIIRKVLNSRRTELVEWQSKFRMTSGQELLDIFQNLVGFGQHYAAHHCEGDYSQFDDYQAFSLEKLDEEPDYRIEGVIGSGIKSCALHHLNPQLYPELNRRSLYGLYFLSNMDPLDLPSETSEFLMINDEYTSLTHNIKMDHNYWYPYGLLTLYLMRLYRKIEEQCMPLGLKLDPGYRYIYTACLLDTVWQCHQKHIETMMCVDEGDM